MCGHIVSYANIFMCLHWLCIWYIWGFASKYIMYHISACNRSWAFKFFVGIGGLGVIPTHMHMCICTCMCVHAWKMDVHGCKQEVVKKQNKGISNHCLFLCKLKLKIIKYGFKHIECRLVYVYIMLMYI